MIICWKVIVADNAKLSTYFIKNLVEEIDLSDVTSSFAMEQIKISRRQFQYEILLETSSYFVPL